MTSAGGARVDEEAIEASGLERAGGHHSLGGYVRLLWRRRAYLWHVPRSELAAQEMNTVLGNAWHLLNPALAIAVYYVIFGVILDASRGSDNYIGFLTAGVFVFQYSQRSITNGANSITNNLGLIRSIQFPRALLPLSLTVRNLLQHIPALAVAMVMVLITGEGITPWWLLLPSAIALQTVFNAGMSLAAARAAHTLPDIANLLPFLFRLLFYGSGILFVVESRVEGAWLWVFRLNPFYDMVEIHRSILLDERIDPIVLVLAVVWTVVAALFGLIWFHRDEAFYGSKS